jgi:hypothetical protein
MSQYPSPYQPPGPPPNPYGPYSPPQPDAFAAARRAGLLQLIMGGIVVAGSVCCIGVGALLPRMLSEHPELLRDMPQVPGMTPEIMRFQLIGMGVLALLLAMVLITLGSFVRRGSKGATVASIVLVILSMLYLLLQAAGALMIGRGQGVAGACMLVIPLSLFSLLLTWLIQAMRSSSDIEAMRNQYAQQYWQSAYQQQLYRQSGPSGQSGGQSAIPPHAGFPPPPTPPPPPPPPPPQQQSPRGPDNGPSAQG